MILIVSGQMRMDNGHNVKIKNNILFEKKNSFFPLSVNSYSDNTSKSNNSSSGTDSSATGQMDPAWLAYYQSMNYYNMMQSNMTATTTTTTPSTSTKSTDSTANTNPATGQPDYSQQWIEYYRSVGQNELADQIAQQMKEVFSLINKKDIHPLSVYFSLLQQLQPRVQLQ